jgi:hypothetical protein
MLALHFSAGRRDGPGELQVTGSVGCRFGLKRAIATKLGLLLAARSAMSRDA